MEKTTTEFASELSLNIKTLQNKISYESKKGNELGTLRNRKRYLSDSEQDYLKELFFGTENKSESKTESKTEFSSEIQTYKEQLKEKDTQINALNERLAHEQELNLIAAQNLKIALDDKNQLKLELEKKSLSWWKKIFSNKGGDFRSGK